MRWSNGAFCHLTTRSLASDDPKWATLTENWYKHSFTFKFDFEFGNQARLEREIAMKQQITGLNELRTGLYTSFAGG
jgi:hypothetical protein